MTAQLFFLKTCSYKIYDCLVAAEVISFNKRQEIEGIIYNENKSISGYYNMNESIEGISRAEDRQSSAAAIFIAPLSLSVPATSGNTQSVLLHCGERIYRR